MGDDLSGLKSELRSVVVSSPTQVDARSLNSDYRKIMGRDIPYFKYGYRDLVVFLKERCSDCFVFTGLPSNPSLTLIVPDSLKHIDKFVQHQKSTSVNKYKGKRRSIPQSVIKHTPPPPKHSPVQPSADLVFSTFRNTPTSIEKPTVTVEKATDIKRQDKENHHNGNVENNGEPVSRNAVKSFLKKRLPLYRSTLSLDDHPVPDKDGISSKEDSSGKQPSSSSSSTKRLELEILKSELMEIISAAPTGVWCTDLIGLYRERYERELNFTRLGYTSLISLVLALEARVQVTRPVDTGDWLLHHAARAAPAPPALRRAALAARPAAPAARPARPDRPRDPDDALPGVDFDPDVFPADCMDFMESIPAACLEDFRPGASVKVIVGEVYSPSHFWLIRYGEGYSIAMEDMMDDMTHYYAQGEGKDRWLACGAVRVGHYCSSVFENDWHRSIIVKILDSETVKVRHVDYGTVEAARGAALKPLLRRFAALPAQALRARLAGARPAAAGRRWPRAAAHRFLDLVRDRRLFASVVALDREEKIAEVLLIDTRGAEDASVTELLIRGGHADERRAPAAGETFLYPRFEALESGESPSFAEIHVYLRDGIALDYVEAYRRHVPVDLPPPSPSPSPSPAPSPPSSPPASASSSPAASPAAPSPPSPAAGSGIPLPSGSSAPALAAYPWPPRSPQINFRSRPPHSVPTESRAWPSPPAPPPPAAVSGFPLPSGSSPAEFHPRPTVSPQADHRPRGPPPPQTYRPRAAHSLQTERQAWPPPPGRYPLVPSAAWAGPAGAVTLSVAECEVYRVLCGVEPAAAQWYMSCALARALRRRSTPLNAAAPEFRMPPPPPASLLPPPASLRPPPASLRPPPGF